MAEYGKIYKKVWRSPRFKQMQDRPKLLVNYLFSCPHSESLGIFPVGVGYIMADLNWSHAEAVESIKEAIKYGWILYDFDLEVCLVNDWYKEKLHTIDNPNQVKKALADVSDLPRSKLILQYIKQIKENPTSINSKHLDELLEGLHNRLPDGLGNDPTIVTETQQRKSGSGLPKQSGLGLPKSETETEAVVNSCDKKNNLVSKIKPKNVDVLKAFEKLSHNSGDWIILVRGFQPQKWVESTVLEFGVVIVVTVAEKIYRFYLDRSIPVPTDQSIARVKFRDWCEKESSAVGRKKEKQKKSRDQIFEEEFDE